MAVSSVQGSTDLATQAIQQSKKNTTTQQTQHPTAQTNNTQQIQAKNVQQQQQTQAHAQAQTQTQTAQAPKPVVNTSGQKTGQILNATA